MEFNPCFVIPHFNHSDLLADVLTNLNTEAIPCVVVDDGSDENHRREVRLLSKAQKGVNLTELPINLGKGGAVMAGLRWAHENGFTHAVQVDADGQHDLSSLPKLIETAKKHPDDLVAGRPVYDEDVPMGRLIARYITHFWVWVETLSFDIKDSMCGFRCYPLKACWPLLQGRQLNTRMEFDIQIMVKLHWAGTGIQQIPVKVNYPENGRSHFLLFNDNARITLAHTKMVFGMLWRLPKILFRRFEARTHNHWLGQKEVGSQLGMKIVLGFYRLTGRKFVNFILFFVVSYYYLTASSSRKASKRFLDRYRKWSASLGAAPKPLSSFWHIYNFASSMVDKGAVWIGDIKKSEIRFDGHDQLSAQAAQGKGAVFLSSHFGNIEVCRCLVREYSHIKVNVLMYTENAKKFNSVLASLNLNVSMNLISVDEVGIHTGVLLKDKIDNGEWIFIMADRASTRHPQRSLPVEFMGEQAHLPLGPFALADLMGVPVYAMHCYKENGHYQVGLAQISETFNETIVKTPNRDKRLSLLAEKYKVELEQLVLRAPLQWFNFYNFWKNRAD